MKKSLFILTLLIGFFCQTSFAQFTLRVAGGYALPGFLATENIDGPIIDPLHADIDALGPLANITDTINGKAATYKAVKGSYGQGMNFSLAPGFTFGKYFNIELGISYLKSATITADQTRQLVLAGYGGAPQYEPAYLFAHITSNAFGVSLSPAFTVQAPIKKSKFWMYMRVGISMPVFGGLTDHVTIDQSSGLSAPAEAVLTHAPYYLGKHTEVTLVTQGAASLGFNGALGAKYNVLPYLSIFLEVNGQYLVTKAKSAKITQWDADGVSLIQPTNLPSDPTKYRQIYRTQFNFVNQLNGSNNNAQYNPNYSTSQPKDDVMPQGPFSNTGFNIGITLSLSKKTLKKQDKDDKK